MINCKEFLTLLSDFIEGGLSKDVAANLEEHSDNCDSCRIANDNMRLLIKNSKGLENIAASADFEERLMIKIRAEQEDAKSQWNIKGFDTSDFAWKPYILSIGSAAAIALIALWINVSFINEPQQLYVTPRLQPMQAPETNIPEPPTRLQLGGNAITIGGNPTQLTPDSTKYMRPGRTRSGTQDMLRNWRDQVRATSARKDNR